MKILYLVDYYQPQLGYSEFFIPQELKKKGHVVKILTSNYYYPFPNYEATAGKILGDRIQQPGKKVMSGIEVIKMPMKYEVFTRAIFGGHRQILETFKPDLVIVNKSAGFNVIRMAQLKKEFGYKLLTYDAHLPSGFLAVGNLWVKEVFYWLFRRLFSHLLNTQVDTFVAVQEDTKIIMNKYYGQDPVVHIPLGTDTDRFYFNAQARKKIRQKLGIPATAYVVIYTGKIIETKGVHLLFAALSILNKKYSPLHTILVGNGSEEYVARCFAELPVEYHDYIHVTGFKDNKQLYQYYSAADLGVWPLEESTAMNDAAACRLPFIANSTIGARIRLSNKNALLYKKNDVRDLAKQIAKLYGNPKLSKEMGRRGEALINSKLSWSKIVDQYLSYVT